jgi:hypothetical protein
VDIILNWDNNGPENPVESTKDELFPVVSLLCIC